MIRKAGRSYKSAACVTTFIDFLTCSESILDEPLKIEVALVVAEPL